MGEKLRNNRDLLASQTMEIGILKAQVQDDGMQLLRWQDQARLAEQQALEAQASLHAWYHNPLFAGMVGFVGGVAASTAIVILVWHP